MFLANLLERLAEMFPKQDYQSRLERYIAARRPSNITEAEYWANRFEQQEFKGLGL
jgi:hypothetical protein